MPLTGPTDAPLPLDGPKRLHLLFQKKRSGVGILTEGIVHSITHTAHDFRVLCPTA